MAEDQIPSPQSPQSTAPRAEKTDEKADEITSFKPAVDGWQVIRVLRVLAVVSALLFGGRAAWRSGSEVTKAPSEVDLKTARGAFTTQLLANERARIGAAPEPPAPFQLVHYPASVGALAGYLSADPSDGKKHAAVLWAHGKFGGLTEHLWVQTPSETEASIRAFHEAGLVLFCPGFRGENDNPGRFEMFYGEVDDLLAARDFLAGQSYVDPDRIYLVGVGPGGTLALLAAVASDRFRAIVSISGAPDVGRIVSDGTGYGNTPFDIKNDKESYLRSAIYFTKFIKRPTFYFDAGDSFYRWDARQMKIRALELDVPFTAFFFEAAKLEGTLPPLVELLAKKFAQDAGPQTSLRFGDDEVAAISQSQRR